MGKFKVGDRVRYPDGRQGVEEIIAAWNRRANLGVTPSTSTTDERSPAMKPITVVLKLKTKYEIAQVLRLVDPQTDPDTFDTLLVAWREACKRERHWRRNARKRSAA